MRSILSADQNRVTDGLGLIPFRPHDPRPCRRISPTPAPRTSSSGRAERSAAPDRTYGEDRVPLDQDLVQVEVNLDKGEATLSMKVDGKVVPLGTGKTGPIAKGKKLAFELSLQGNAAKFSLGGAVKVQATDKSGKMPASGYFQFEGAEGLHVHLDNLRVTIDP